MANTIFGTTLLPNIGRMSYRNIQFDCRIQTTVKGEVVPDSAGRTTKFMQYTFATDAIVSLDRGNTVTGTPVSNTIDNQFQVLRQQLSQPAGTFTYTGKGFGSPFIVNAPGGKVFDVAWGPVPKVLEFIPLGGSRSASVKWQCVVRIPEQMAPTGGFGSLPLLQFNFSTVVGYDADGYSTLDIKGLYEMAMTRPVQSDVTLATTADDLRESVIARLTDGWPLDTFKVTTRKFAVSEDKRTLEFDLQLQELPPIGNPAGITTATGEFTFKPERSRLLQSTFRWICTLRGTYTVPPGKPRRLAWLAFVSMWRFRMIQSQLGGFGQATAAQLQEAARLLQNGSPGPGGILTPSGAEALAAHFRAINNPNLVPTLPVIDPPSIQALREFYFVNNLATRGTESDRTGIQFNQEKMRAIPVSLSGSEGLYEDSRTITFEATWTLLSNLRNILWATGLWRRSGLEGGEFWESSIKSISGPRGPLANQLDPAACAIVDFGNPG